MSKEILQRIKLLMEYDMSKTSSENLLSLNESTVLTTVVRGTARNVVDDILRNAAIVDDAGRAILKKKDLLSFLSTGSKAAKKAVGKLNTDFLRSPGVLRQSKSLIIDDMVSKKTFLNQFAGKTQPQIKNLLRGLGYSDDIAAEIAKKTSKALKTGGTIRPNPKPKPKGNHLGISSTIWTSASQVIRTMSWANFLKWGLKLGLSAAVIYFLWKWFTGEEPTDDEGNVVPQPDPTPGTSYRDCEGQEVITMGCKSSDVRRLQGCIGVEADGAWGPNTQARMVELGLGQGISVSDIDQICKTQDDAEQEAEQNAYDKLYPKVRGSEAEFDVSSNANNTNFDVTVSTGSVDDFS